MYLTPRIVDFQHPAVKDAGLLARRRDDLRHGEAFRRAAGHLELDGLPRPRHHRSRRRLDHSGRPLPHQQVQAGGSEEDRVEDEGRQGVRRARRGTEVPETRPSGLHGPESLPERQGRRELHQRRTGES